MWRLVSKILTIMYKMLLGWLRDHWSRSELWFACELAWGSAPAVSVVCQFFSFNMAWDSESCQSYSIASPGLLLKSEMNGSLYFSCSLVHSWDDDHSFSYVCCSLGQLCFNHPVCYTLQYQTWQWKITIRWVSNENFHSYRMFPIKTPIYRWCSHMFPLKPPFIDDCPMFFYIEISI